MEDEITIDILKLAAENVKKRTIEEKLVRVPPRLYQAHPKAYIPMFVSVGPFHHVGQNFNRFKDVNILAMETQKRAYMLSLLERRVAPGDILETCWNFVRENLDEICSYYCDEIDISPDLLAKIMLVDGCFLLNFLSRGGINEDVMHMTLRRDLLLLENQIPFFVLEGFSYRTGEATSSLPLAAWRTFELSPHPPCGLNLPGAKCIHLLDLIGKLHHPPRHRPHPNTNGVRHPGEILSRAIHLRSATRLRASGVTFRCDKVNRLLDLRFSKGVLMIPTLVIDDYTETLLTNLVAHEHLSPYSEGYFTSYVFLMTHLIESKHDLRLLVKNGIIDNRLGSRDDASKLFCNISKHFVFKDFYYADLCNEIEAYASSPWRRHRQVLKRKYFSSPWTALSVFAATILLVLTLLQTMYTMMSYYQPKSQ